MSLPFGLYLIWSQFFVVALLALVGAFIAERVVGNAPKFGFMGSLVLGLLGAWLFIGLPVNVEVEPRFEDIPLVRGLLGSFIIVTIFAFFRKQGSFR
jgi:uncharacterized membrane protein YeaQ/YmgE (transglycosylase-associated protein family)